MCPKKDLIEKTTRKVLYIGTSESNAKTAPIKGLKGPIILSDVYPGHFAFHQSNEQKWGIIEVEVETLTRDNLYPFHGYIEKQLRKKKDEKTVWAKREKILSSIDLYKKTWQESLKNCGCCLYIGTIPPLSISKVCIYDPFGKNPNKFVNESILNMDPWETSVKSHKESYHHNLAITRWLLCMEVTAKDILNGSYDVRTASKLEESLQNKFGLDFYYIRSEKANWWK